MVKFEDSFMTNALLLAILVGGVMVVMRASAFFTEEEFGDTVIRYLDKADPTDSDDDEEEKGQSYTNV